MSKNNPSRFNSLAWVKHEIDHTLIAAREAIQRFVSLPDEPQHLVLAKSHLRDVHGALEVANLEGAAMLTQETIDVVSELAEGKLNNTEETCEQVLRALIQLPDYLEYVQSGESDSPLVLVSAVNDLRSLRRAELIADEIADIPGLEHDLEVLGKQPRSDEDLQQLAELTRLVFEVGLLGWYTQNQTEQSLGKMALVLNRLRLASKHDASRRLWWVATAVIEALKADLLSTSAALKQLIGRVDREIKRLFNSGEEEFAETVPLDLVKNLLHYIAAAKSGHPLVDEVRNTYFTSASLPTNRQLAASENSLSGQNTALNQSISNSLSATLESLKFELDEYQQGGFQSPGALSRFLPGLGELAETLDVIGLGQQKQKAVNVRSRLEAGLAEDRRPTDSELQYFAHMLVDIEDSVANISNPASKQAEESRESENRKSTSDQKYIEVRNVVIQEVLREIERCKDGIQRYAADLEDLNPLRQTLGRFTQVAGSMHLLSLDSAGDLVNDIRNAIELIINGEIVLDIDSLDNLAESIAAVEVYLEVLDTSNVAQETYIDIGLAALKAMRQHNDVPSEHSHYNELAGATEFVDDTPTALLEDVELIDPGTLNGAISEENELADLQAEFSESVASADQTGEELSEVFGAEVPESELLSEEILVDNFQSVNHEASAEMQAFAESLPGDHAQEIEVADLQLDSMDAEPDSDAHDVSEISTPEQNDASIEVPVDDPAEEDAAEVEEIVIGNVEPEEPDDSFVDAVSDLENQMEQELTSMHEVDRSQASDTASDFALEIEIPEQMLDEPTTLDTEEARLFPDIRFGEPGTQEGEIAETSQPEIGADDNSLAETVNLTEASESIELPADQQSLLEESALYQLDDESAPGTDEEPLDYVSMTEAEIDGWQAENGEDSGIGDWVEAGNTLPALNDINATLGGAAVDEEPSDSASAKTADDKSVQQSDATLDSLELFPYQAKALYGLKMLAHQPDEDVYSIFHEELTEESTHLRISFGQWLEDLSDQDALTTARRSFHTIKGSARLIGAQIVGEYAWLHEKILNGVLDRQLKVNTELTQCVAKGIELLPRLQKQLEHRELCGKSIHLQVDWAERIGNGEFDEPLELQLEPEKAAIVDDQASQLGEPVDVELMEVFSNDSPRHLATLSIALKNCRDSEGQYKTFDDEALRAVHTLNGAARTAKVEEIYRPTAAAEQYLRELSAAGLAPDDAAVTQLEALHGHVDSVLQAINSAGERANGDALAQNFDALTAGIHLRKDDEQKVAEAPAEEVSHSLEGVLAGAGLAAAMSAESVPGTTEEQTQTAAEAEPPEPAVADVVDAIDAVAATATAEPVETQAESEPEKSLEDEEEQPGELTQLMSVFLDECDEILSSCDRAMARWQDDPQDNERVSEIKRDLHTLKGSARMAGIEQVGTLSHSMENLLQEIEKSGEVSRDQFTALNAAFDQISASSRALKNGEFLPDNAATLALLERVLQGEALSAEDRRSIVASDDAEIAGEITTPARPEEAAEPEQGQAEADAGTDSADQQADAPQSDVDSADQPAPTRMLEGELDLPVNEVAQAQVHESQIQEAIRIQAESLDRMVDNIGEVSVCQARVEQQVGSLNFNLQELDQTVQRVTEQLRRLEMEAEAQIRHRYKDADIDPGDTNASQYFDPLELDRYSTLQQLSRSLAETTSDLSSIHQLLTDEVGGLESVLQQQSRVSTELQQELMRTRMSKFNLMVPRLRRVVRRTALEFGKEVNLSVSGDDNEMDRKLLESIVVPLEHLLRNAVVHGIETPEEREAANKPQEGQINIAFVREGHQVVIDVKDDGRGIDEASVMQKAVEQNLIESSDELTQAEIHAFILQPGFSTAEAVTEDAGRGVGMDVVNTQLKNLNGVLEITSTPGEGCNFRISLPFTLAINQALLLEAGENIYAIPMGTIDGVMQTTGKSLTEKFTQSVPLISYGDESYELTQLDAAMNHTILQALQPKQVYPVILARSGEQQLGFVADRIVGNREIVVKPMGALLQGVDGISGATILGDGSVVMILDVAGLIRISQKQPDTAAQAVEPAPFERRTVLVVDDSITIRKVTSKMLERHNYNVVTAKDGMDAIAQLQNTQPDIILLDIEMPRMDGFEFAAHVRNSDELTGLPIIMISSRTGKKHRSRAEELGVNHFLGKPYQDDELLGEIDNLLKQGT